ASAGYNAYCHSGRTTGENCGHTATSTNAQVCTSSGCKSPVIAFTGGTMIQPGDSGGAFYAIGSDGRAWIRGNVIATNGTTGWAQP
ncbi:S1 family peptidase, partial [Escherichia coli]|uniref:S1 family peptidase n=1 Tax=Escherichia coli TaxID=562 RepID=UPI002114012E